MKASSDNPSANQLGVGVTPEHLEQAVRISGYPLQRVVAEQLGDDFMVTEEWGYLDRAEQQQVRWTSLRSRCCAKPRVCSSR
jgi:hypothetical protein